MDNHDLYYNYITKLSIPFDQSFDNFINLTMLHTLLPPTTYK